MKPNLALAALFLAALWLLRGALSSDPVQADPTAATRPYAVIKTDAQWRKLLPPETYRVTRQAGTELAFSGQYAHPGAKGTFVCADCGNPLFSSDTQFDSGTGWPSFWKPLGPHSVREISDSTLGMQRTEVVCDRCGAHLGHVFDDGPKPTGLRYCMNSVALKLVKK